MKSKAEITSISNARDQTKDSCQTSKAKRVKITISFWVVYGAHDGLFLIFFCCMSKFSRRPSLIRLPSMNRNKKTPRTNVKSSRPNAYKFIFYCCCICERIRHPFPYIVFFWLYQVFINAIIVIWDRGAEEWDQGEASNVKSKTRKNYYFLLSCLWRTWWSFPYCFLYR